MIFVFSLLVNVTSLDHVDLQLSACGLSLHKDLDSILILRASYSGCLVQQQVGCSPSTQLIVFHSLYSSHNGDTSQCSNSLRAWWLIIESYGHSCAWNI